jgi:2-polyprenyl-6-methoxyphenol hydroxylase-like FAD-dependent oxidoreductase
LWASGPNGLLTAIGLARHGVRSELLEAEQKVSDGTRAIVLRGHSMEILRVWIPSVVKAQGSLPTKVLVFSARSPWDANAVVMLPL